MIRLSVRCGADAADGVLAELLAMAPAGVEQVDGDGAFEFAIYGAPGELPELGELEAELGGFRVEVSSREVDEGWEERWREFHRPVEVPGGLRVRPPWEPARPPDRGAGIELVIEPAGAFGTGAHPTTRLCLELLVARALDLDPEPLGELADWGTGSGLLALAGAALGFHPVLGLDSEAQALEAARANARLNGLEIDLLRRDLRFEGPLAAPSVVANLTAPILRSLAESMVSPPSWLCVSGLLEDEADAVSSALAARGLVERRRLALDGWGALEMSAP